jgi:hypothetical protein
MRLFAVALAFGIVLSGCSHGPSRQSNPAGSGSAFEPLGSASVQSPSVTPVSPLAGNVVYLNPLARYVILDFFLGPLPEEDQRLNVYRNGQKVGEIKISRESNKYLVAADIMAGEAQVGDIARPD